MQSFLKVMGGRKMMSEQIKTRNSLNAMSPAERAEFVSFGLPRITDMEGDAEC